MFEMSTEDPPVVHEPSCVYFDGMGKAGRAGPRHGGGARNVSVAVHFDSVALALPHGC